MIRDFLKHGAENAIKAPDLAKQLGYPSTRELQQAVRRERNSGEVILSSSAGFFLPGEDEQQAKYEIERFIASLSSRAVHTLEALKSAKRAAKRIGAKPLDV